jgi:signal transduction histidine kinase
MTSSDLLFGVGEQSSEQPEAERRVEQLLALNRAAIAITSELELDKLLQRIVDMARWLVGCHYSALGVLGDDGYIARFPTSGISDVDHEKIGAPPRGHGLLGVMLRAGRSLRIPDINKDTRRVGFPANHPPMTSLLGVPIFVQGKLVGDLYLTDKDGGPEFSEEDEWIVQLLATHAATALTNALLHAENKAALEAAGRERARSNALLQVIQAINRTVHLEEVASLIVQATVELLGAKAAAFYLLEDIQEPPAPSTLPEQGIGTDAPPVVPTTSFYARYAVGLEQRHTTEPALLPVETSLAGRAVLSKATQVVPDTDDEPDLVLPRLEGARLRSLVAVPLVAKDMVLGAISAYADRPDAFNSADVALLEAFGAAASAAIYNATIYEQAQNGRELAEREGERLRELEQMKDEFLSTAAHELRTPLTTLRISAGLVDEQLRLMSQSRDANRPVDGRLLDLTTLLVDSSKRMQSLVNDLLDLTRLEQGRTILATEIVDLREVVRDSVEATMPLFTARNQNLSMKLPETSSAVLGDRQRLEQIVINLLSNANKYSPEGSSIEVRITRSGDESLVTVRDNGPGVPEEERELIFRNFYRSSLHRNDRTASTGLGLPIARKIAEMHGGKLWVEPGQGGGSIFALALPPVKRDVTGA